MAAVSAFTVLGACGGKTAPESLEKGGSALIADGVELDYDNMFFDDFTGGIDPENWYIGKQAWGANGNGGVIPQNVNYTDDGVLVLTGNGEYYTAGDVSGVGSRRDGTLSGAALISKDVVGPGRYEVKMKVLPRLGACSAFWTFAYDNATGGNHEIDIELPGGTRSNVISFENILNTNYIKETANNSEDIDISEVTGGAISDFADGEWHTFGFDWYTLKENETWYDIGEDGSVPEGADAPDGSCGRVVYHVDGVVTNISEVFVPFYQSRLWLGVWFPNNSGFVGDANFETDYMYVDYVRYTPFKDQPCVKFTPAITGEVATVDEYPSAPVSTAAVNKIANGDFEFAAKGKNNSGWKYFKRTMTGEEFTALRRRLTDENPDATADEIKEMANAERKRIQGLDPSEFCAAVSGAGYKGSCGLKVERLGVATHTVDSIYGGYKGELSFKGMGKGSVTVLYMGNGSEMISSETVEIDSKDFEEKLLKLDAKDGVKRIDIQIVSAFDTPFCVDDISLRLE